MASLLIIEVKINFSLGLTIQIVKQTNCKMYMHYTVQLYCTLYYKDRAQSVRSQQRKRTSQESEMVTYKHVTEVVRNRCVKYKAKRVDSSPNCNI